MDTGFGVFLTICVFVGLFIFLIHASAKDEEAFQLENNKLMSECLAAHESEWTCKSYIQSRIATREAKSAAISSSVAMGMSAASIGTRR